MKNFKKLVLIAVLALSAYVSKSQSGTKWSTGLNGIGSGDAFGTSNNFPILFFTNGTQKMALQQNGVLQINNLSGLGNRFLQTDANGNLISFPNGSASQVLYGNGVWGNLPVGSNAWNLNSNNLFNTNSGNVGIGTNNPVYKLDVFGSVRITQDLYVGGGIVITDKVQAASEVKSQALLVDSLKMDSTKAIYGTTRIVGDLKAQNKLDVTGNASFSGNFKLATLAGSPANLQVDNLGNVMRGSPVISCVPGSPQWSISGDNFYPYSTTMGNFNEASIGTCNNYDFILKSNAVNRAWFQTDGTVSFGAKITTNSGGPEYKFYQGAMRLSGGNSYGGPQVVFDGGSTYGDWGIEYTKALTKNGLNFWKPFGSPYAFNNIFFLADDGTIGMGTDNPTTRLTIDAWSGDGYKVLSDPNTNSIDVYNKNTGRSEFRVKSNGITYAREVIVTLNSFPDYVFASNYNLPKLSEVRSFIIANHRLSNMPSAEEVEKNGANLGEIQKVTVEKLEEAYLYIIQLEEKINALSKKIELIESKK